ncbi:MAG: FKBP-type peptidyl-prolyl cis-trans isomerase [Cyclobacteriaceae bacterium]|nr:FKBP-type peptidyl-prolyl cis-trans isomerase [Cyclobacteriaceae bacterium]MCH8515092.1 FKBP-type peptidyl-prolyl cis-trans isomerase [Cyclobacteriaceae bacterium]
MKQTTHLFLIGIILILSGYGCTEAVFDDREDVRNAQFAKIDSLLAIEGISASLGPSNIRYAITKEGTGRPVNQGSRLIIRYKSTFLDGEVIQDFISSESNQFLRQGSGAPNIGFDQATTLLRAGDEATFWVHSEAAYGRQGNTTLNIPPNTPLRYDVQLLQVIQ